jgi:2-oxoglutarate ferredoxin oxidoreductase subunit beta
VREHNAALNRIDFIDLAAEARAEPAPGEVIALPQADGTELRVRKLHDTHDVTDRIAAMNVVQAHQAQGEIVTGLVYVDPEAEDLHQALGTPERALNRLGEAELCPGPDVLAKLNAGLR